MEDISQPLTPRYLPQHPILKQTLCSFLNVRDQVSHPYTCSDAIYGRYFPTSYTQISSSAPCTQTHSVFLPECERPSFTPIYVFWCYLWKLSPNFLRPDIFLSTLYSNTLCVPSWMWETKFHTHIRVLMLFMEDISQPLTPRYLPQHSVLKHTLCSFLNVRDQVSHPYTCSDAIYGRYFPTSYAQKCSSAPCTQTHSVFLPECERPSFTPIYVFWCYLWKIFPNLLRPDIFLSTLYSNTLCVPSWMWETKFHTHIRVLMLFMEDISQPLTPRYLPQHSVLKHTLCSFLNVRDQVSHPYTCSDAIYGRYFPTSYAQISSSAPYTQTHSVFLPECERPSFTPMYVFWCYLWKIFPNLLRPDMFLSTLYSNTLCVPSWMWETNFHTHIRVLMLFMEDISHLVNRSDGWYCACLNQPTSYC